MHLLLNNASAALMQRSPSHGQLSFNALPSQLLRSSIEITDRPDAAQPASVSAADGAAASWRQPRSGSAAGVGCAGAPASTKQLLLHSITAVGAAAAAARAAARCY